MRAWKETGVFDDDEGPESETGDEASGAEASGDEAAASDEER